MQITKNFSWQELIKASNGGAGLHRLDAEVLDRIERHMRLLQEMRDKVGRIVITSAQRDARYGSNLYRKQNPNLTREEAGIKAQNSQHFIFATDIRTLSNLDYVFSVADGLFDGVGRYDWGLHLDLRGEMARW